MKQNLNNFIIGKSNEFAYRAIKNKLEFNTLDGCLIIYGESSIDKTHFLKAIKYIYKQDNRAVTYITAENFLNDLV